MAWDERLSKSSGTVHNAMRYRAAIEHDPAVIEAMARKAALVDEAVAALRAGHRERLGPIMDRDFDLRRSVYDLPADQVRMIDIARRHGSHAKFAGSGGAVSTISSASARNTSAIGHLRPPYSPSGVHSSCTLHRRLGPQTRYHSAKALHESPFFSAPTHAKRAFRPYVFLASLP